MSFSSRLAFAEVNGTKLLRIKDKITDLTFTLGSAAVAACGAILLGNEMLNQFQGSEIDLMRMGIGLAGIGIGILSAAIGHKDYSERVSADLIESMIKSQEPEVRVNRNNRETPIRYSGRVFAGEEKDPKIVFLAPRKELYLPGYDALADASDHPYHRKVGVGGVKWQMSNDFRDNPEKSATAELIQILRKANIDESFFTNSGKGATDRDIYYDSGENQLYISGKLAKAISENEEVQRPFAKFINENTSERPITMVPVLEKKGYQPQLKI